MSKFCLVAGVNASLTQKASPHPRRRGSAYRVSGTDKSFLQKATKITKGNPAEGPGTFKASLLRCLRYLL